MFLINKGEVITKLESVAYTGENLVDADHKVRITAPPTYSHNINEYRRKILDGTLDRWTSVPGKRFGTVTFKVDLYPAAAATTEPNFSHLLQMCGLKVAGWNAGSEVAVGAAVHGISWRPHSDWTHMPGTIEIQELGEGASANMIVTRMVGCMGNLTVMIGEVGEPVQLQFEMSGSLVSVTGRAFASKLDLTSPSNIVPPAVLDATVTLNSVAQDLDSFEVNMSNAVSPWTDPSNAGGIKGFYISDRDGPMLTFNPTLKLIATEDFWTQWTGASELAFSLQLGSTPALTIQADAAQYTQVGMGEREGARIIEKTLLLTNSEFSSTNSVFEILQGAKS